jgi:hypothetical protein
VRSSRDVKANTCRSKLRRIGRKSRESVDEIRQKQQMSKSQGFVHVTQENNYREGGFLFFTKMK